MLPKNIAHEIRSQIQETVFPQVAQLLAAHIKLEEVHIGEAKLTRDPVQPLLDMLLVPFPWVWKINA